MQKDIHPRGVEIRGNKMKKIHMEGELTGDYYKAEKVDQIIKENRTLKEIMLFSLSKYDLCSLCEIKGQNLPRCTSNTDKDCLKNILCLWEAEK